MRLLTTLALGALALASTVQAKDYEVCVIGAGAGGTSAAVYANNNGYSVLLIDVQRNLGGHCDTYVRPPGTVLNGSQPWIDTGVAQLADTQKINLALDPENKGPTRWTVNTTKYVETFVKDPNYLVGLNIPEDPFTSQAGIYAVDETSGIAAGPLFNQSQLPDFNDPINARIFGDLQNLTTVTYPWLDNGQLTGPVPAELLVPFATFMEQRKWTDSLAMINLFTSILWYAVAMDKFENLPTVYALRFLAPTPQLLFAGKDFWYGFNGGCQRLYDAIYDKLKSLPYNNILVNTTVTSIVRPKQGGLFDFLIPPKITVKGFTLGVDKRGATTNTSFTHTCGSLIFGMPAVPSSLAAIGFQMDHAEQDIFGTVKSHGYFGGAVESTGRAIKETLSNNGLYNILHVNFQEPPFQLSPGDPTWISLQGNYGASSPSSISLLAGFSSNDLSQRDAQATMQAQLNAHLTQSIDGATAPVLDTAKIVDFHAHRYQARPATSQLSRTFGPTGTAGWYQAIKNLQGYRNTYWVGATVNFPLHHVCMNDAYNLINDKFPNKCTLHEGGAKQFVKYIICLAQGRKLDWNL